VFFLYYFLIKKAKIPLHLSVFGKFEGDITKTNAPQGGGVVRASTSLWARYVCAAR